jgi:hypothetical protein
MSALFQLLKPKPKPKPTGTFAAQVEASVTQLEAMIDSSEDEYVDPRNKDSQLKRMSVGPDYGMDYLGDKEAEAGDDPGAKPGPGGSSSQAETEDCEWDADLDSPVGGRGDCETSWLLQQKSQAVVIAMAQGLVRVCEEPYLTLYVFDTEKDDLVKNCPQKNQMLPSRKHLVDEALRRAKKHKIKPVKKSAGKPELLAWLKLHAVKDRTDLAFIRCECKKIYTLLKDQSEEHAASEKERTTIKNWTVAEPWLRLYHAAAKDEARALDTMEGKGKRKDELDARNSDAHPPTYYAKVAEFYNSPEVFATYSWPELHESFSEIKLLDVEDMPGGRITAEEVKSRLSDTRAKLIMVSGFSY